MNIFLVNKDFLFDTYFPNKNMLSSYPESATDVQYTELYQ